MICQWVAGGWPTIVCFGVADAIIQVPAGRVKGGQQWRVCVLHKAIVEHGLVVALAHLIVGVGQLHSTQRRLSCALFCIAGASDAGSFSRTGYSVS